MARRYGRAPRGERLRMAVPHGHWMTTTFVGGLRLSGMTAPLVIDRPMTGAWFEAWVARALAPTLKPGDVVILDNLPAHKSGAARNAIETTGAWLLFLPPYSPDFNPIENAFAKALLSLSKGSRRSCARPPRASSTICPAPSVPPSTSSRPQSAPTTLPLPDMMRTERNLPWILRPQPDARAIVQP